MTLSPVPWWLSYIMHKYLQLGDLPSDFGSLLRPHKVISQHVWLPGFPLNLNLRFSCTDSLSLSRPHPCDQKEGASSGGLPPPPRGSTSIHCSIEGALIT